jgi:hypothetical protein
MNQQIKWEAIPDRASLDAGFYRMKIKSITELPLDERNPFVTMLGAFEVEEPKEHEGDTHFERYRLGDESDPMADKESTLKRSMGAKNLKKLLKASQSPFLDTNEATYEAARGNVFIAKIVRTPGRAGTINEGQEFSNMRDCYSVNAPEALQVGQKHGAAPSYANGAAIGAGQEMECAVCQAKVPRDAYGKHLLDHRQASAPQS